MRFFFLSVYKNRNRVEPCRVNHLIGATFNVLGMYIISDCLHNTKHGNAHLTLNMFIQRKCIKRKRKRSDSDV